jgi:hypothetical protein
MKKSKLLMIKLLRYLLQKHQVFPNMLLKLLIWQTKMQVVQNLK